MLKLVPTVISASVFVAFAVMYFKMKLDKKLALGALGFAVVLHFIMHMYRNCVGYEGYSNYGNTCPNGYIMVDDPMLASQKTCVPVGHRTESATTGFRVESK